MFRFSDKRSIAFFYVKKDTKGVSFYESQETVCVPP
ncbi:hypothetical protein BANAU_0822 [Bacillus velezensis YAU B9601-Y2]|nr:hypothetical protein BANAU_0822 [Bacillus velezensis YAU B9601-Y2]